MHSIDRGPQPGGIEVIQARYAQRWVQHYRHGVGRKPSDNYWRKYLNDLERVFCGLCAYCEESCKGEVDHFRPKSRFPELVYTWSNWLFACHDCNQAKGGKWPTEGYVDPCATSERARPESYFEFDVLTAELLPREGLSQSRRNRAQKTISDLRLNGRHHLKKRLAWILLLSNSLNSNSNAQIPESENLCGILASRGTQHSSITRAWLSKRGYSIDNRSISQES